MNSINVSILIVLATVAILSMGADVSQAKSTQEYVHQLWGMHTPIDSGMATLFSVAMYWKCRDKSVPSDLEHDYIFAVRLGDESSNEYKCGVKELEKGEDVLGEAVKNADPRYYGNKDREHYDRIRDRTFGGNGQENINDCAEKAISQCKEGVAQTEQLFADALRDNAIAGNEKLVNALRRFNTCKLLAKNGVSKQAKVRLGKWAVDEYKNAKTVGKQNDKRWKKEYRKRNQELSDGLWNSDHTKW